MASISLGVPNQGGSYKVNWNKEQEEPFFQITLQLVQDNKHMRL